MKIASLIGSFFLSLIIIHGLIYAGFYFTGTLDASEEDEMIVIFSDDLNHLKIRWAAVEGADSYIVESKLTTTRIERVTTTKSEYPLASLVFKEYASGHPYIVVTNPPLPGKYKISVFAVSRSEISDPSICEFILKLSPKIIKSPIKLRIE